MDNPARVKPVMHGRVTRYRAPLTVACQSCPWQRTGMTQRPLRRASREHQERAHPKVAV